MAAQPDSTRALVKRQLFSVGGLPGWVLYVGGVVELTAGWPFPRPVGVVTILLGLFDHSRQLLRARGEAETYEWTKR
jgi:hypothetical protein